MDVVRAGYVDAVAGFGGVVDGGGRHVWVVGEVKVGGWPW